MRDKYGANRTRPFPCPLLSFSFRRSRSTLAHNFKGNSSLTGELCKARSLPRPNYRPSTPSVLERESRRNNGCVDFVGMAIVKLDMRSGAVSVRERKATRLFFSEVIGSVVGERAGSSRFENTCVQHENETNNRTNTEARAASLQHHHAHEKGRL